MARLPSEKTIEEQLAEIDPGVIAKGQYLYLYARPTVRTTYWLLMVRNVYRPYTLDSELERPSTRQATEVALQHAALVFGCKYHIIDQFSIDTRSQPYRTPPHRDELTHPIEIAVIPDPEGFKAVIRNARLKFVYPIGPPREDMAAADKDARIVRTFYETPQQPLPLPAKKTHYHCTAPVVA